MYYQFILLLIGFFLDGCIPPDRKAFMHHMEVYAKEVTKESSLTLVETNSYMPPDHEIPPADKDIMFVRIMFESHEKLSIEEVRNLTITNVRRIIQGINEDPALQPYLNGHTFTWRNLQFRINFLLSKGFVLPPYVAYAWIGKKKVFYDFYDVTSQLLVDGYSEYCEDVFENTAEPCEVTLDCVPMGSEASK